MTRDAELESPAGQMASAAAAVVRRMQDKPGIWDFLEEFKPQMHILELEFRLAETIEAQTAAAAEEGKRLYLLNRALELRKALDTAKAAKYDREHKRT
ncbi:MAG: hypothetical protein WCA19_02275 [Candidatus Acidiferrales bacterium]